MDIFSHGLWASAAAKGMNEKKQTKINLWFAAFWGMFPDLFAFGPATLWIIWLRIQGKEIIPIRPENADALERTGGGPFVLSHYLYNYSHSIFIFAGVLAVIMLVKYLFRHNVSWKNLPFVMLGWPLHILMDIPTHSYRFYPTPFLWPFSDWKFNGFSWGQWWFILLNYGSLFLVFWLFRKKSTSK